MEGDEFDYDWYQGEVDAEGKPDGRGIFLALTIPMLWIAYYREGCRHGKYSMIRYDGQVHVGTCLIKIGEHGVTYVTMPNGSVKKQMWKGNEKKMDVWMKECGEESSKDKIIGSATM